MEESPDDNNKQDKKIIAIVSIVLITIFLIALYNASGKIYSKIKNKKTYANYPEKTNHPPINKVTDEDKPAVETAPLITKTQGLSVDQNNEIPAEIYEKGGITLYEEGLFCDVPEVFEIQSYRTFGLDDEYIKPDKPLSEIIISTSVESLDIFIPVNTFESNPKLYLEAEHDGELFYDDDKDALHFRPEMNYENEIIYYYTAVSFINKNLYSTDYSYVVRLRDCQTDEVLSEKIINLLPVDCNYAVYRNDYKSPFTYNENRSIKSDVKMHFLFKGKSSEGNMIIISYGVYSYTGISYVPFTAIKAKNDKDGVCSFDFKIREPGQYKIDFYNEQTGEIKKTSAFDYLEVRADQYFQSAEPAGTKYQVNSPEGLRLRSAPWGETIGVLKDREEVIQTANTMYPFLCCMDNEYGYWIPVKVLDSSFETDETKWVLKKIDATNGWIFSGFLRKIEE